MPAVERDKRLEDSRSKIHAPFELDDSMRFYSPQENVDAFSHERVETWHDWLRQWEPAPIPADTIGVALLVPCTKYKPYPTSREHRAINGALLRAGWEPTASDAPDQLQEILDPDEDPRVLENGRLRRDCVVIDRIVMSEPLGLVPYTEVYSWEGRPSPATAYDDPGLFEDRGTSVSPHRADSTARQREDGTWAWGPAEREAYVDAHERLVELIGAVLDRVRGHYEEIVAWVSPGLTHRSFLASDELRATEGLPRWRMGQDGRRPLRGVLDGHPDLVSVLPTVEQREAAMDELAARLSEQGRTATPGAVRAIYARGDGNDTPLGLPELLGSLVGHLEQHLRTEGG